MSEMLLPQNPAPPIESLLDLAAGVDFLIRSAHQRQAAIAADQLARGLLYHYRALRNAGGAIPPDEADLMARKVIIAIVEAKMMSASARAGRAPHISHLRSLVEDLLTVETGETAGTVETGAGGAVHRL